MNVVGHGKRLRPSRLGYKLFKIRQKLAVSQQDMVRRLCPYAQGSPIYPGHISEYESGKREPSLFIILAYAKVAGISTDILIDDSLDLP